MLCYRCGSHVLDTSEICTSCGQKLAVGHPREASGVRKRASGSAAEAPYKEGDRLADRYEILALIGTGPLGYVFRVRDAQDGQEKGLKVIHSRLVQTPEERQGFAEALKRGTQLSHPGLVPVMELGEDQDRPFFTMALAEGTSLRKLIEERGARGQYFTLHEVESLFRQLTPALDAAHRLGAHTDLKPENILVQPDSLRITDFGLGLGIPRPPFMQAQRGRKADRYIAPEYMDGGQLDERADIFALGIIAGEMVSGQTPEAGALPPLLRLHPELPASFEALYQRTLHSNPLTRPRTAGRFFEELCTVAAAPAYSRLDSSPGRRKTLPSQPLVRSVEVHPSVSQPLEQVEVGDSTQPVDAKTLAHLTPHLPDEETEVLALAGLRSDLPPPMPPDATAEQRAHRRGSSAVFWLVLLTVAGLLTGGAGGYWLLQRMRPVLAARSERPAPKPAPAPVPVTEALPTQPVPVEEKVAEPPVQVALPDAGSPPVAQAPEAPAPKEAKAPVSPRRQSEDADRAPPARESHRAASAQPRTAAAALAMAPGTPCPEDMKLVSAGNFKAGTAKDDPMLGFDERSLTSRPVEAFCIDPYEFPNRKGGMPLVNIPWHAAKAACERLGKRLCEEDEWEKACKGPGNHRFPYGSTFEPNACNTEDAQGQDRSISASGRFVRCRSGYGVFDLSGNVAEWTDTAYGTNADKTQKGGAFDRPDYAARCSARKNGLPNGRSPEVGFRCCADPRR